MKMMIPLGMLVFVDSVGSMDSCGVHEWGGMRCMRSMRCMLKVNENHELLRLH